MFIQTEATPNPMTLKFSPGMDVLGEGTRFYTNLDAAAESPLAQELFKVDGVTAIFLGADFITVTKIADLEWSLLKAKLLAIIMDFFVEKRPVLLQGSKKSEASTENNDPLIAQIKELLETRVRPSVAMDGGDIIFHSFENGIVRLEMHGSCSGCPSSTITLKNGIENMLKHYIPEIESVEAV